MSKICVIGHFGFGRTLLNGQTIKTKIITEEIENKFGKENVVLLDLAGGAKKIPYLLFKIPFALSKCDNLVMMPVENGLRFLTPVLNVWNVVFKKRLHYVVIGGWLPKFMADRKWLQKGLKNFSGVYIETNTMKTSLEKMGLDNLFVLPNCKKLDILSPDRLVFPTGIPYRLCTFSRVMKEKGIEDAINAITAVNKALGYTAMCLDIYGQVWDEYQERFDRIQRGFPDYIRYCGFVNADKSVEILQTYFALLFPTYYEGEGFAGTLIDAYAAGVPVIATDWRYNSELIIENTGFTYPTGNQSEFIKILMNVAENPCLVLSKKHSCIEEANKFRIDRAIQVLIRELERE